MKLPAFTHLLDGFWTPLHDRTYWRLHTIPHLAGGLVWWTVFLPAGLGWWAVYAVGALAAYRQEILREQDPLNFPLWAICWDAVADAVAAAVATLLWKVTH
jgi:hypothetical protein